MKYFAVIGHSYPGSDDLEIWTGQAPSAAHAQEQWEDQCWGDLTSEEIEDAKSIDSVPQILRIFQSDRPIEEL